MPFKVSFFLLLFLFCCAVCLHAQTVRHFIDLIPRVEDTIDGVYSVSTPVFITPHPGYAYITVQAYSTINLCISPYAPVTFNLSVENCGKGRFFPFVYNTQNENPVALFLDDFSMNFRGLEKSSGGYEPYTPLTHNATLLQQVPYYISLSFQNQPSNSSDTGFTLLVTSENKNCTSNQVPNVDGNCQELSAQLTPTKQIAPVKIAQGSPQYFSFVVDIPLEYLAQSIEITLFSEFDTISQIEILIAFGQVPTATNYQYNISTGNAPPSSFLLQNSYTKNLTNPLNGVYYAQVMTSVEKTRNINIQYSVSNCSVSEISTEVCANTTILGSSDTTGISFNGEYNYYAVSDSTLTLGVKADSSSIYINMFIGVNSFPDAQTYDSGIGWFQNSTNGILFFSLNATRTYVISIQGPPDQSGLIWQGYQCPYNCNDHGSCNNFSCDCDSGYSGDYCSSKDKKLSTLYIVLIIIGGAVVLAILIGVPVALYLNNRKRARYERV